LEKEKGEDELAVSIGGELVESAEVLVLSVPGRKPIK